MPGAGAAGGMGFCLATFMKNVTMTSGADLIFEVTGLKNTFEDADIFVTGEGCLDGQSFNNKGPVAAARLAKAAGARVYVFCGRLDESVREIEESRGIFDKIIPITPDDMSVQEAMKEDVAERNLKRAVRGLVKHYCYMLRCADGTIYTGYTTNPQRRLGEHNDGTGAKYTRNRRPCRLVHLEEFDTKEAAMSREYFIKHRLTRQEKEQLIRDESFDFWRNAGTPGLQEGQNGQ